MLCPKCGAEVLEGGRFCGKCGAPVAEPSAAQSDAELERLAAQGDQEAFAELYSRHSGRVYDFLLRMVRDSEEAADLMQETFLRAMRALSTEKRGAAFSTWLFTIARNLALKRLQRRKRTIALAEREGEEGPSAYQQVNPDRLADPQAVAEAQELAGLVWEAAVALEPKQYSLLDLHVRQGLESAEIAQVLGVSRGNAYTMMSRLKDTFESAVASLFMLRLGRRECPELNRLLEEQVATALSPAVRKLVERHTARCEACQEQRRRLVSPANILRAFAPVPLPLMLKQRVAEALVASWVEVGGQAATAGLKAFLSQPAAKLASLPTAWKAGLIAGALTVAVGGGLGGWMGATGGVPGSGEDEEAEGAIPAVVRLSPTPTPSAVATSVASPSPTIIPSPTRTATLTPSPTPRASVTLTPTPLPAATPTPALLPTATPIPVPPSAPEAESAWLTNPANNHLYRLTSPMTWPEAETQAVAWGGHLVTINDAAENEWLVSVFGGSEYLWIGYTDKDSEGQWKWISGEKATYTNWFRHACGAWEPTDTLPGEDGGAMNYSNSWCRCCTGGCCSLEQVDGRHLGCIEGCTEEPCEEDGPEHAPGKWNDLPMDHIHRGIVEVGDTAAPTATPALTPTPTAAPIPTLIPTPTT